MTEPQPTAMALAGLPAISSLSQEEAEFVYNVEYLGLPVKKALSLSGMPPSMVARPHIIQAREMVKRELRGALQITKEDVVHGMHEAIGRAKLLAEPATEIIGWEKIAKLLGYDAPQRIDVNVTASIEVLKGHVKTLSDAELARLAGASGVIDADFYEVGRDPT